MSHSIAEILVKWRYFVLFIGAATFTGCKVVVFDKPIGKPQPEMKTRRLVGEWLILPPPGSANNGEARYLSVRMRKNGKLRVAKLEWSESAEQFIVFKFSVEATQLGNDEFLTSVAEFAAESTETTKEFRSVRLKWINQSEIELYPAEFDEFVELWKQKQISGKLDSDGQNKYIWIRTAEVEQYLQTNPGSVTKFFPTSKDSPKEIRHTRLRRLSHTKDNP